MGALHIPIALGPKLILLRRMVATKGSDVRIKFLVAMSMMYNPAGPTGGSKDQI